MRPVSTPPDMQPVALDTPPHRRTRPWLVGVVTAALAVLVGVGGWLFAPSDLGELQPPPDLASYEFIDGVVSDVSLPTVTIEGYEPLEGATSVTFGVRDGDLRYFDVVHLRAHSSIGLPTRIYYERDGERLWAVYKEDAPANSGADG